MKKVKNANTMGFLRANGFTTMISIEPLQRFDDLAVLIKYAHPSFVSIGADSKHCNLPEPPPEKVNALIRELEKFTEVRVKSNLNRILK